MNESIVLDQILTELIVLRQQVAAQQAEIVRLKLRSLSQSTTTSRRLSRKKLDNCNDLSQHQTVPTKPSNPFEDRVGAIISPTNSQYSGQLPDWPGIYGLIASPDNLDLSLLKRTRVAVSGIAADGIGLYGFSESLSDTDDYSPNIGVNGVSEKGTGVQGCSEIGDGVCGSSTSGIGVAGSSTAGVGLSGLSLGGVPLHLEPAAPVKEYNPAQGDIYVEATGNGKLYMFTEQGWRSISFS